MSHITQIAEGDATGMTEKVYQSARKRTGGVANILQVMSRDGRVLNGSMQLYVPLMKMPNALSPARREMLAAVVSNANDCYY